MANRAYLYSGDRDAPDVWDVPEEGYYDSRWSIPAAWFFFFHPSNLQMIEVSHRQYSWQDLILLTDRKSGMELFAQRIPLLHRIVAGRFDHEKIAGFLETVGGWPGRDLILQPSEIFAFREPAKEKDPDAWNQVKFSRILAPLDDGVAGLEVFLQEVGYYTGLTTEDPDGLIGNVIGYTYR
jgi:hypothetical protein